MIIVFVGEEGIVPNELASADDGALTVPDAERLSDIMQALASPIRLRILSVLRSGPRTVTALSAQLEAGQTTVSNHLRLLRHLGLVEGNRDGRRVHYALFDEHVADLLDEAIRHLRHLPSSD